MRARAAEASSIAAWKPRSASRCASITFPSDWIASWNDCVAFFASSAVSACRYCASDMPNAAASARCCSTVNRDVVS